MTLNEQPHLHRDHERGATAIMVAASLLLLMGLAAIAVDSGILFGDRRQQASAADVGALAAVQFARTSLPATHLDCIGLTQKDLSACRGAEEALAVIDGTLPGRYPDDSLGTQPDWESCVDPDDDTLGYTQHSFISDCISFTSNLQRARVVLPGTDVETSFGKALGFGSAPVGAFAEAGLELNIVGGVLPFAIGPSGAGADQACFTAGDSNQLTIPPCGSGTQGNYGKLDVRLYGNGDYPTPEICTGATATRMATNIAVGSDHILEPVTSPPGPVINDVANCANIANPVNQLQTLTGNAQGAIANGFFNGISAPSVEGRLMCKGGISLNEDDSREDYPGFPDFASTNCVRINNLHPDKLDDTPLWGFVNPGGYGVGIGQKCAPGQTKDRDGMQQCINWWRTSAPQPRSNPLWKPLFTTDLISSPRFAGVPRLDADPGGGAGNYNIVEFRPIYIETLYLGCNANTCDSVHSPGEAAPNPCPNPLTATDWSCGWPGNGNKLLEAASAFMLTLDMLPDEIADKFPYQEGTVVYNLHR